jgi:nicotinamide riboside transporter PnuC
MIETLGVIAATFELLQLFLLSKKKRIGFIFGIACNISWIIYVFLASNTYGLLLVAGTAFFINIYGFFNWRQHERKNKKK